MMMTLAEYYRVSQADIEKQRKRQAESESIGGQRLLVQEFVRRKQSLSLMRIVEFVDDGYTGTNFNRPQFSAMIEMVKRGEVDCIIVKDFSRFGRNYLEVGNYLDNIFPLLGVRFISIGDQYDSNAYLGKTGGIDVAFRNLIYDSYCKDLSTKVRTAMRVQMEQGRFLNHVPYGYQKLAGDKHRMVPDPQTAPIVRRIFEMALQRKGAAEIAKALNDDAIPTPQQYKGHKQRAENAACVPLWTRNVVYTILTNRKYTGAMVAHTKENRFLRDRTQRRIPQTEWIIAEGMHEAIVSREEFDNATRSFRPRRDTARRKSGGEKDVFFCGHCGRRLQKTFGRDTYYFCSSSKVQYDGACTQIKWSKTALEDVLLPIYNTQLSLLRKKTASGRGRAVDTDRATFSKELARLDKAVAACDAEKITLYEQYRGGALSQEKLMQRKGALDERKALLLKERAEKQACQECRRTEQAAAEARRKEAVRFLGNTEGSREVHICAMYDAVSKVTVFNDTHISVEWKFEHLLTPPQAAAEG